MTVEEFTQNCHAALDEEEQETQEILDMWTLLGLLEEDFYIRALHKQFAEEFVLGHYDYKKTKKLYVQSFAAEPIAVDITLAHELCHALEDQHYDLGAMQEAIHNQQSDDAQLAFASLVEGSATQIQERFQSEVLTQRLQEMTLSQSVALQLKILSHSDVKDVRGSFPIALTMFSCGQGVRFLESRPWYFPSQARHSIEDVWQDPPRSTEQVLHPEKYWEKDHLDDPIPIDLPDLSKELDTGCNLLRETVAGEAILAALFVKKWPPLSRMSKRDLWQQPAAAGWGSDCLQLYEGSNEEQLLLWAIRWDNEDERDEFEQSFSVSVKNPSPFFRRLTRPQGVESPITLLVFSNESGSKWADLVLRSLADSSISWQ